MTWLVQMNNAHCKLVWNCVWRFIRTLTVVQSFLFDGRHTLSKLSNSCESCVPSNLDNSFILFVWSFFSLVILCFSSSRLCSHYCLVPLQKTTSQAEASTHNSCTSNLASQRANRSWASTSVARSLVTLACLPVSLMHSFEYLISSHHAAGCQNQRCSEWKKKSIMFQAVKWWTNINC